MITGADLIAWGYKPGPWFKDALFVANSLESTGALPLQIMQALVDFTPDGRDGVTKRAYIFDIDGTLMDTTHRQHLIDGTITPKDWPAFFEACDQDPPIPHMIGLVGGLAAETDILFVTGRSADVRQKTVDSLNKAFSAAFGTPADWIKHEDVYMRPSGDHRADTIVKSELLDQVIADGWTPIMVFEDRASVVTMWRERGIPCCQVAPGDF